MTNSIYNLSKSDLKIFLKNNGFEAFRADQIWNWLYVKGVQRFSSMGNISKQLLIILEKNFSIKPLDIKKCFKSKDGTIKWLFSLNDNRDIETVYIPEENRSTICISSQVGCTLSCAFCHTGTMKFIRNLDSSEIIGQVLKVKNELNDWQLKTEDKKVTNIVFMGMGEPFFNYDNVMKAVNVFCDEKGLGLSKRKVTISTSGVVPKIENFKLEKDVNLAISLHAPFDEVRNKLVPINKKWPLEKLMRSLKSYKDSREKKRITIEYIMLENVNDSIEDAKMLIKLLKPLRTKVNLIPFNPWPGTKYKVSPNLKIKEFQKYVLEKGNIVATIRTPRGEDILAACGQLKSL